MIQTGHRAVSQWWWSRRFAEINQGNGHRYWSALQCHFHLSQPQGFARLEGRFFNPLPFDKCAVGRAAIANQNRFTFDDNLTMSGGDGRVLNDKIILAASPQAICAGV